MQAKDINAERRIWGILRQNAGALITRRRQQALITNKRSRLTR